MPVTSRSPFREMTTLRETMNQLFDETGLPAPRRTTGRAPRVVYQLPVDVYETPDAYTVETTIPGVTENEVEIEFEEHSLTISGTVPFEENESAIYHIRERWRGHFERTLSFPVDIDVENIEATITDGVLSVALPKAASARARQIPVTMKS